MSGIRINEIPRESSLDGKTDLVHVYKLIGGSYKSFSAPLSAVAFQGPSGLDGTPGNNGTDGNNGKTVAQLVAYRRLQPGLTTQEVNAYNPRLLGSNDNGSYDFTNRIFTAPTGWSAGVPAIQAGEEDYLLYSTNGVAEIEGTTGTDNTIVWADPDTSGIQGLPGDDGRSTYQALVFTRSRTQPTRPRGGSFDFLNDTLLAPLSSAASGSEQNPLGDNTHDWYIDTGGSLGPPGDAQLYMCNHQFSAPGDKEKDITTAQWSIPTRFATDGANGMSTYFASIYKRSSDVDQDQWKPGAGDEARGGYYDFRENKFFFPTNQSFTDAGIDARNSFNGWSEEVPEEEVLGQRTPLWQSTTVASSTASFLGSGDVIDTSLKWSFPVKVQQPAVDGNQGNAVTQVRAYLRSVGATPPVIGNLSAAYFDFENKILNVSGTGWSSEPFKSSKLTTDVDYGADFLYVAVGVASSVYNSSANSYPNDTSINWADPLLSSEDGEAAVSTYLAQVYTRYSGSENIEVTSSRPINGSFNFSNNTLLIPTSGDNDLAELAWSATIPTGLGQMYVSQRNFAVLGNSGTDTYNSNNPWTTPAVLAYDGVAGNNGITNALITIYYGSDTELVGSDIPDFPADIATSVDLDITSTGFGKPKQTIVNSLSVSITNNQLLSGTVGTGWYTQLPSNDWIYATEAVAADLNASDSNYIDVIGGAEWSDTVAYRKPGGEGLAGLGASIVSLYKRTGTSGIPSLQSPTGNIKYYIGSASDGSYNRGDIEVPTGSNLNGWLSGAPSYTNNNDHYLWQINATASSRLCADEIASSEWSVPVIFTQNPFDLAKTTVSHVVQAYRRDSITPTTNPGICTVALSGANAGEITSSIDPQWSVDIPAGDQQIYIVHATAAGNVDSITDTDTIAANEWSSPVKWGIVGDTGPRGVAGNVAKVVALYKRTGRNPSPAVTEPILDGLYSFNADTFTFDAAQASVSGAETWTLEIPAKDVNDRILWQTFATALCSTVTDVYSITATKWKEPKALMEDGTTITPVFSSNFADVSASLDSIFLSSGEFKDHTHINFSDEYTSIDSNQTLTRVGGTTIAANALTFIKIKGETGPGGLQGLKGAPGDGVQVVYADDATGTNVSFSPQTGYEFVLYHEWTGSSDPLSAFKSENANPDYAFLKYKGENANQIVPVYASAADGTDASLNIGATSTHVSFIEDTNGDLQSDFNTRWPTISAGETFVRIKGDDGSSINIKGTRASVDLLPGSHSAGDAYIIAGELYVSDGSNFTNVGQVQGPQGNTGLTGPGAQIHFKYANGIVLDGNGNVTAGTFTGQTGEELGDYLGVATSTSANGSTNQDPTNLGDYTWTKVKADPKYTHIKYADAVLTSSNTSDEMSDDPTGRTHIGISINNASPDESTSGPGDYTWSKIAGEAGIQGIRGPVGSVPIFASAADGTGASLTQSDSLPYVFFYTGGDVNLLAETGTLKALGTSTSWKKITGDSLFTHIKYADRVLTNSDPSSDMTDDPDGKKYIGISLNNASSEESSSTPGNYTWSLIRGAAGLPAGFDAVAAYSNDDSRTIVYDENNSELILSEHSGGADLDIGMVYPAVNVNGFRAAEKTISGIVRLKVTSSLGNALPGASVSFRAYEYNSEMPAGKIAVGTSPFSSQVVVGTQVSGTYSSYNDAGRANVGYFKESASNSNPDAYLELYRPGSTADFVSFPFEYTPSPGAKYVSFGVINENNLNVLGKIDTADEDDDGSSTDHVQFDRGEVSNITATITPSVLIGDGFDNLDSKFNERIGSGKAGFHAGDFIRAPRSGTGLLGDSKIFYDYYGYTGTDGHSSTTLAAGDWELRETTDKNIHVKALNLSIGGSKGTPGTAGITANLIEIFATVPITADVPTAPQTNAIFNISDGSVTDLPTSGVWDVVPDNAASGYKIYRATVVKTHDADTTSGPLTITPSEWSLVKAWSVTAGRTAPTVSRLASYEYFDSNFQSITDAGAPQSSYYSFRSSGTSTAAVNTGYGSGVGDSTASIATIKQILFSVNGKGNVPFSGFWSDLNSASEFLWKYGSSWIVFQRTGPVSVSGDYTGVRVTVLDHSEDISLIGDLPGFHTTSNASIADVVFGYNPTIIKQSIFLHQRGGSTAPALPSDTISYNFRTESLGGSLNGWSKNTSDSDGTNKYLWRTTATATAALNQTNGDYEDEILSTEWAAATILAQDGFNGVEGSTFFQKFLYTRTKISSPLLKTNWATGINNNSYKPANMDINTKTAAGEIGKVNSGSTAALTSTAGVVWSEDIPSEDDGQFLWVIIAPVIGTNNVTKAAVTFNQWAEPVLLSKDGTGLNSATVRLYKRTDGSDPSAGTTGNNLGFVYSGAGTPAFTYNFSTANLDIKSVQLGPAQDQQWSSSLPATGGSTLWISRAIASGAGTTDEIGWDQWSAPEKFVTDGTGLIFIKSFVNRAAYIAYIDDATNGYNGIPPHNSYHIETGTDGRNVSYLYTGGQNTTDKNSDTKFTQLTIDGVAGQTGTSFVYKGTATSFADASGKAGLAIGHVYRITGTDGLGGLYVYEYDESNGVNAWKMLTTDGSDGPAGAKGDEGNSAFICYSTASDGNLQNPPTKPPLGSEGNESVGPWYTSANPPANETYNWMSQKVAKSASDSSVEWSAPIHISGVAGEAGFQTISLKIFKRSATPPGTPASGKYEAGNGAYDFDNNRLLIPVGWSSSITNAGSAPVAGATPPADAKNAIGYEWALIEVNAERRDSNTWSVDAIDNTVNLATNLWSSEAVVSVQTDEPVKIDNDIFWSSPLLEKLNGTDLIEGSVDADNVFGAVKNGGGCAKIVAQDKSDPPQLLSQAAYDALADQNHPDRAVYGWKSLNPDGTYPVGGVDAVQDQTLYLIF